MSNNLTSQEPLAFRVRPRHLKDFAGQQASVGVDSWLYKAIEYDRLSSIILHGPSGTGKTTLASIIAHTTEAEFIQLSAIDATVKDVRRAISEAKDRKLYKGKKTILFIDEIHRFSKSQQDALLHAVEDRTVILVGATTENPLFEVNSALISRSRVIEFSPLTDKDIASICDRALTSPDGLNGMFVLDEDAKHLLVRMSGGDARQALTTLELASQIALDSANLSEKMADSNSQDIENTINQKQIVITQTHVQEAGAKPARSYDKKGDMHYDVVSAFIKSMRGSDPDASVYWLARMLDAGEDPKFIARRIFILASEDIGNADPQALLVAEAAFRAVEVIGLPEARISLAQACIYMALAPKSNASYNAINKALQYVKTHPEHPVPSHLRDRHKLSAQNYGAYLYPHNYAGGWVKQQYLPDGCLPGDFFQPSERGWEIWRVEGSSRDRADLDDV